MTSRWWFYPALILVSLAIVVAGVGALTVVLLWPSLPSLEALTDYRPKIPLRVYSAEGELIGEFGVVKRAVVRIKDVPEVMRQAILAAEDDRFYQHGGVDFGGVARAALANVQGRREGASTITMQVAAPSSLPGKRRSPGSSRKSSSPSRSRPLSPRTRFSSSISTRSSSGAGRTDSPRPPTSISERTLPTSPRPKRPC